MGFDSTARVVSQEKKFELLRADTIGDNNKAKEENKQVIALLANKRPKTADINALINQEMKPRDSIKILDAKQKMLLFDNFQKQEEAVVKAIPVQRKNTSKDVVVINNEQVKAVEIVLSESEDKKSVVPKDEPKNKHPSVLIQAPPIQRLQSAKRHRDSVDNAIKAAIAYGYNNNENNNEKLEFHQANNAAIESFDDSKKEKEKEKEQPRLTPARRSIVHSPINKEDIVKSNSRRAGSQRPHQDMNFHIESINTTPEIKEKNSKMYMVGPIKATVNNFFAENKPNNIDKIDSNTKPSITNLKTGSPMDRMENSEPKEQIENVSKKPGISTLRGYMGFKRDSSLLVRSSHQGFGEEKPSLHQYRALSAARPTSSYVAPMKSLDVKEVNNSQNELSNVAEADISSNKHSARPQTAKVLSSVSTNSHNSPRIYEMKKFSPSTMSKDFDKLIQHNKQADPYISGLIKKEDNLFVIRKTNVTQKSAVSLSHNQSGILGTSYSTKSIQSERRSAEEKGGISKQSPVLASVTSLSTRTSTILNNQMQNAAECKHEENRNEILAGKRKKKFTIQDLE